MKTKILSISLMFIPFLLNAQEYKPSVKVSKGQEYKYQTTLMSESAQAVAGQEMKTTSNVKATQAYYIENIAADGTISVLTTVMDIEVKAQAPNVDTTLIIPGKSGNVSRSIYSPNGNFIRKEIAENAQVETGVNTGLDGNMTGSALFVDFPGKSIKPGEKWTKEATDSTEQSSLGGKLFIKSKTDYTYTGKGVEGNNLIVSYSSVMDIVGTGSMQGMDLNIEGTGMRVGTISFDPANGVVQQDKGKTEIEMTISISGPTTMSIPVSQKLEIDTKIIK